MESTRIPQMPKIRPNKKTTILESPILPHHHPTLICLGNHSFPRHVPKNNLLDHEPRQKRNAQTDAFLKHFSKGATVTSE